MTQSVVVVVSVKTRPFLKSLGVKKISIKFINVIHNIQVSTKLVDRCFAQGRTRGNCKNCLLLFGTLFSRHLYTEHHFIYKLIKYNLIKNTYYFITIFFLFFSNICVFSYQKRNKLCICLFLSIFFPFTWKTNLT